MVIPRKHHAPLKLRNGDATKESKSVAQARRSQSFEYQYEKISLAELALRDAVPSLRSE